MLPNTLFAFGRTASQGAPTDWRLKVRAIRAYTGAGFLVALAEK